MAARKGNLGSVGKGKSALPRRLQTLDLKVAEAITKRDAGEELTRHQRWLLAFEDLHFTPETAAAVLADVASKKESRQRVRAVEAMMRACHDEAGNEDQEKPLTLADLITFAGGREGLAEPDPPVPAKARSARKRSPQRKAVAKAGAGRKKGRRKAGGKARR